MEFQITADSQPIYDGWGWDDHWSCEDWIRWHQCLRTKYGLQQANYIFIDAFHKAETFADSYNCRSFNSGFREYARQNGFFDALFSGIGIIAQPLGWITDTTSNIGEVISTSTGAAADIAKLLRALMPALIVIALIMLVVYSKKQLVL